jgi:arabinooligosaccharide transport system permease protein
MTSRAEPPRRPSSTAIPKAAVLMSRLVLCGFVLAGALLTLAPFAWMVLTSLKRSDEVFRVPIAALPEHPLWSNYARAVTVVPFSRGVGNTLILVLPPLVVGLLATALAAYAFARLRFPGRELLFGILMGTMMIPGAVTMVPLFILFRDLNWLDTYRPLILPACFGGAYGIFLLRQFFRTLPGELEEAARIDGCNPLQTFLLVILPLSKPGLATLAVFGFMGGWNDFMGPLIYLNSGEKFPLSLVLAEFQSLYYTDWTLVMAASVLSSLPVILLFLFCQRYFIEGIALTGMKA